MPTIRQLLTLLPCLSLAACVFDDDWNRSESTAANQTENFTYHAVEDVDVRGDIGGDFDGFVVFAGDLDIPDDPQAQTRADTSHARDMVGFISERPALTDGDSAQTIADRLVARLFDQQARADELLSGLISASTVSEQTYAGLGAVTKQLSLDFSQTTQPVPTALALSLAQLFGVNRDNGDVQNWPSRDSDEPESNTYTLHLSVIYVNQDQVVVMASVAPTNLADDYNHLLRSTTTPTNVTLNGLTLQSESQRFTAKGGGGLADFLFVIDNSGSMGDEQAAVRDAADIFSSTMSASGLDFEIATITTDSTFVFRDTRQDGGFTRDLDEFRDDILAGTTGSATERGIYNAEQALLSSADGDDTDGIVTQAGHPRANANLSVIIIGDERSQYPGTFDPNNNLFIDREYRVFAIIDTALNDGSQYDDLANSSGGSVANINNAAVFPDIFTEIAILAGAASSRYALDFTPIESSIAVRVNGETQNRSSNNGWQYIIGSNALLFSGDAIPQAEAVVDVTYNHLPIQTWLVEPATSIDARFAQ